MKQIGMDWTLSLPDLERSLHENQATDLSALCLVARATIGSVAREFLNVSPQIVFAFAKSVEELYLDVPFHNAHHAAQVCHHANTLVEMAGIRSNFSKLDQIALSVAALCHDISHFGRSNAFLVETRHELAVRYNDTAVLENFHAAMTFQVMKSSPAKDISAGLSKRDERRFRARVIQLILATDTSSHFQLVAELRMRLVGQSLFLDPQLEETDKRVVLSSLIRAADLGCHAMPLDTHTDWVHRLAEEYAHQGDDERALGLSISPMCDRRSQDIASMQIGFMNLVVMPLYDEIFNLVKSQNGNVDGISAVCGLLVENHTHWNMQRNLRVNTVKDDQQTVSDGSELYIPAPHDKFAPRPRELSSPRSHPDLIQRVYSSEIRRSESDSVKVTRPAPPSEKSSVVSLTYSQAHGYHSDEDP
jgi:cAMP-specific phosphodiesterase 4